MEFVSCLSDKSRNRVLNQLSTSPVNSEGTCLENTAATKFSKIFSDRQLRQSVKMFRLFRDRLCPYLSPEDGCRMNSEVHVQLHIKFYIAVQYWPKWLKHVYASLN
jgi:hypothetical protein